MFWFFGWVLVFLVTSSFTLLETDAGEPSVYHIHSPKGNFFMAPRMTITSTQAQHILTKNVTNCTCKSACFAVACKAWSVVKVSDGKAECRLANVGPTSVIPIKNTDATYFFREDSIEGTYSFQEGDDLLYVEMNNKMSFDNGNRTCGFIPGHRLIIIKTEVQYRYLQILWENHQTYWVVLNLKKIVTGLSMEPVWGDGTPYNQTELQEDYRVDGDGNNFDVYVIYYRKIDDYVRNYAYTIICQANPLGVEW